MLFVPSPCGWRKPPLERCAFQRVCASAPVRQLHSRRLTGAAHFCPALHKSHWPPRDYVLAGLAVIVETFLDCEYAVSDKLLPRCHDPALVGVVHVEAKPVGNQVAYPLLRP